MVNHRIYSAVIIFTLAFASSAANAADSYSISMRLTHEGKEFGSPSVVVERGVPATVEVAGPGGYKLRLTAFDDGSDQIRVSTRLDTAEYGSIAPEIAVRSGQTAAVAVGDLEMNLTAVPYDS